MPAVLPRFDALRSTSATSLARDYSITRRQFRQIVTRHSTHAEFFPLWNPAALEIAFERTTDVEGSESDFDVAFGDARTCRSPESSIQPDFSQSRCDSFLILTPFSHAPKPFSPRQLLYRHFFARLPTTSKCFFSFFLYCEPNFDHHNCK